MKREMAVDGNAPVGSASAVIEFRSVDATTLYAAKKQAKVIEDGIKALSPMQAAMAAGQIVEVMRLVRAVEAL